MLASTRRNEAFSSGGTSAASVVSVSGASRNERAHGPTCSLCGCPPGISNSSFMCRRPASRAVIVTSQQP